MFAALLSTPDIQFADRLGRVQLSLYIVGWIAWVPTYVVALWYLYGRRRHECVVPAIAVCGNIAQELLWFVIGDFTGAPGLRWIYFGAFVLDLPILIGAYRFGGSHRRDGLLAAADRRRLQHLHELYVSLMLVSWFALYGGLRFSYEVPLGSVAAYVDNTVMSAVFLWQVWAHPEVTRSKVLAWSKFAGTLLVTVYVALQYHGSPYALLYVLAAISTVLDVSYLAVVYRPEWLAQSSVLSVAPMLRTLGHTRLIDNWNGREL